MLGKTFSHKPPGDGRAGNARNQQQRLAFAAVAQIVLANAVGLDVAAMEEVAHAADSDLRGWEYRS
ncbi:hypothetical protein D3C84_1247510 [compost metagenome]